MIPYGRQLITEDDIAAVTEALRASHLTQGPTLSLFEHEIAKTCGVKYAVAVSSGTAALHLACLAAGIKAGETLITSAITFVASANCALYCGAAVSLTDIDGRDFNMAPADLERKIDASTKIVVPVHMTGQSADMKALSSIVSDASKKHGRKIYLVEDASHAFGGRYLGNPVGCCEFSDMATLSFHPVKTLTSGEGGAVLTNDGNLYERLCMLRSHGIIKNPEKMHENHGPWYYEQQALGFNYRLTDFQAALGLSQLKKLSGFIERRQEIAASYDEAFLDRPFLTVPFRSKDVRSSHHLYVLLIDFEKMGATRAEVMKKLAENGVGSQVHYIPVYRQPYFKERFNFPLDQFPNAEAYYASCLSIPIFPAMREGDVHVVKKAVLAL